MLGRKRRVFWIGSWFLVAAGGVLIMLGAAGKRPDRKSQSESVDDESTNVEQRLAGMSAEERVGQLIALPSTLASGSTVMVIKPGFVGLFGVEEKKPEEVRAEVERIKREATASGGMVPLVLVDQEGGRVQRLKEGFVDLPSWEEVCETKNLEGVRSWAGELGRELKNVGVDGVWGPVVDRTNPESVIMKGRTCSDEPGKIVEGASAYIEGLNDAGVLSVVKHFPGLGGVSADPHREFGSVGEVDWEVFGQLLPMRLADGLMGVMVTHVGVGGDRLPCSASGKCLAELTQRRCDEWGCKLLFTDALEMKAVADRLSPAEAAYQAIMAGEDVLVYGAEEGGQEQLQVFEKLVELYKTDGELAKKVDEAVGRILRVKILSNQGGKFGEETGSN